MGTGRTMTSTTVDDADMEDEEKAFLSNEPRTPEPARSSSLSTTFWVSASVNTGATAAIVSLAILLNSMC